MTLQPEDILIVGAGPAGIAAAIQLKRSRVPFIILEKERVGGLLWNSNLIENYPGFPKGVSGPKLAHLLEKQLQHTGIQINFDRVVQVELAGDEFQVTTEQTTYQPRYLVIATGTKPRPFPITVPKEVRDKIFSEVYPLHGARDQHILIIGAGDAAFDYALNLATHNMISIMHRGDQISCLPLLWERASANANITFQEHTTIDQVASGRGGNKLLIKGNHRSEAFEIETDYLVYAIGREPEVSLLSPELLAGGLGLAGRLFLVGDVVNGYMRQTAIAAGDGLRAAMQIVADLNESEGRTQ